MEFLYWVTLYHSCLNNLIGEERAGAVASMDDDVKFDAFLRDLETNRNAKTRPTPATASTGTPGSRSVSQEEFLNKFNLVEE